MKLLRLIAVVCMLAAPAVARADEELHQVEREMQAQSGSAEHGEGATEHGASEHESPGFNGKTFKIGRAHV